MADTLYRETPSIVAAAISIAAFFIVTVAQAYTTIKFRTKYFIPMVIGGIFEVAGFVLRILSSRNPGSIILYAAQQVLLLVAPLLFAASMYMTLPKLLKYLCSQEVCPIRLSWFSKIFLTGDIAAFLLQLLGSGMQASDGMRDIGRIIAIVGLVIQLAFFGAYACVVAWCDFSLYRSKRHLMSGGAYQWRTLIWAIYITSGLILMRSCFRFAEFLDGFEGKLRNQEIYFYLLDMLPMLLLLLVFSVVHPGLVIQKEKFKDSESSEEIFLAEKEKTLLKRDSL